MKKSDNNETILGYTKREILIIFNELRGTEGAVLERCNSESEEIYAFEVKESKRTRTLISHLVDDVEEYITSSNEEYQKLGKTNINLEKIISQMSDHGYDLRIAKNGELYLKFNGK